MKEKTKVKQMVVLDGGSFLYETGMMMMGTDLEKRGQIRIPFFAFETEDGWVLFDTGCPIEAVPILQSLGMEPHISEENSAAGQLEKIGVSLTDVSTVIVSHLHVDHAGGLKYFPDATICVQKDEYAYAKYPDTFMAHAYDKNSYEIPGLKWGLLQGDRVIIPGLTTLLSPGHTPGLQGLIVELPESGYVILSADSVYLEENFENDHPPGFVWNAAAAQYSVTRFKALQAVLDARFFPGHDFDFYKTKVIFGEPLR